VSARALIFGTLVVILVGVAAYYYRGSIDPADNMTASPASVTTDNSQSNTNQSGEEPSVEIGGATKALDLDRLVSTDDAVRDKALKQLANEFRGIAEPRYQKYGSDLLPVLHRVISNLDDEYGHYAIEAILYMTAVNHMRLAVASDSLDAVARQEYEVELKKFGHYAVPNNHPPMKEALVNALTNSKHIKSRYWSAMALATGFKPHQDTEQVFARQLPLEKESSRVQGAIIDGLAAIGRDGGFESRATETAIMDSLDSSNKGTRRSAATLIGVHKFDGGIERLIEHLPGTNDIRGLNVLLWAIASYEAKATAFIPSLQEIADRSDDSERKQEILAIVEFLRKSE